MSRSSLYYQPQEQELRDPTREELFNGPRREKLPEAIQQMTTEETACTFCGVSYFVFAEVQELQGTVKKYKKTFHDFVRFMERERRISLELRAEVASMKRSFEEAAVLFRNMAQRLATEATQLRRESHEMSKELAASQRDLQMARSDNSQLQLQFKRADEEWRLSSALTEQKLRNEILHLSSQMEKCKLVTSSQEAEFAAELDKEKTKIRQLELALANADASMRSMERQTVTERDELKQQLLGANERLALERETAKQLEGQLRAVHQELSRVVAANETERASFGQLQLEIGTLKQQLQLHEKSKAVLVDERGDLRLELERASDLVKSLRVQISTLEKKAEENRSQTEKIKQDYLKDLEKLRLENSNTISRLQRDHQKTMDDLKENQRTYIEYLQKQTTDVETGAHQQERLLRDLERRLEETEKLLQHRQQQVQQGADEVETFRRKHHSSEKRIDALSKKVEELETEKKTLVEEFDDLQQQHDQQKRQFAQQLETVRHKATSQSERVETEKLQLQRRVEELDSQVRQLQRENEQLKRSRDSGRKSRDGLPESHHTPQHAWGDDDEPEHKAGSSDQSQKRGTTMQRSLQSSNQEANELEKLVDSLRKTLEHKEKEISLLQQTVHRECLERTSLLEKMRSGKVLPDLCPSPAPGGDVLSTMKRVSVTPRRDTPHHTDEEDEDRDSCTDTGQPKASFYERLRRAGQKKNKVRK